MPVASSDPKPLKPALLVGLDPSRVVPPFLVDFGGLPPYALRLWRELSKPESASLAFDNGARPLAFVPEGGGK